jgi:hypothetical protein
MSTTKELIEIASYLDQLGQRWEIAKEPWVKEIIRSVLNRRAEILLNKGV